MAEFLQQCGSWGVLATLAAYAAGVWVNRKTGKALFNPLLMGSIFMIVFLSCFGVPYADYKSSAQPVSWLLMPATVSLAIPLYEKWELLEKNLAAIFASIAAGVLTSLGSVLAMAWLLKLERAHAVSFLPKSVTTAIGMDVAETLGGTAALAGAVIILTGIVGSLLGEKLMAQGIPLVVVETSRTRVDELRERGISAVLGNAANEEIMELAHLDCARWLLLTIPNGYEAGEIVASAREKCPNIEIIARAHYDDEVDYIIDRGANQVVMGEREIARAMLRLLETPPAGEVVTG